MLNRMTLTLLVLIDALTRKRIILSKTLTLVQVSWEECGIRADIVVRKISLGYIFILTVARSHLPMDFHVRIFTNCYRLISCISSSKVVFRDHLVTWVNE